MRKAKTKSAPWRCPKCGAAMDKSSAMSISANVKGYARLECPDCGNCIEAEDMTGLWKAYMNAMNANA